MRVYYADDSVDLYHGDAIAVLRTMPSGSANCCVTSPPYFGLRDYGVEGQMGLEASPAEYVEGMRSLFAEVRRVLADDGTLWLNLGDSYSATGKMTYTNQPNKNRDGSSDAGADAIREAIRTPIIRTSDLPAKNLLGIPWRVAFALQDDGWILRNDIIWSKPNAMPESVTDRLSTKHEHVFLFSKRARYWFDLDPIREPYEPAGLARRQYAFQAEEHRASLRDGGMRPANDLGKNPGDVWSISTQGFSEAHFATMPPALAERCIQSGCKPGGVVLDPFSGSGTTGLAAARHGRKYVGIDINAEYLDLSLRTRLAQKSLLDEAPA